MKKSHLYHETLDWGTYWRNFLRQDKLRFLQVLRQDLGTRNIFLTRAGRMGIILSLKAFGLQREDEVLIPRYMSTCVLDAINHIALPSLNFSERTKAVLFYHHWGYPQNYAKAENILSSRKVWVIEDCANSMWGKSQGRSAGDFGHTAIFSLAKVFEVTYGGVLKVNDLALSSRIEEMLNLKSSFKDFCESWWGEWAYLSANKADLVKWYATLLKYPNLTTIRGKLPRYKEEMDQVFSKQNKNFLYLLKNSRKTSFMLDDDDEAAMAPLCFPILSDDDVFLKSVDEWLKARNIFTGIYHFDINRCMFDVNYKKCVPIPLYASLPEGLYMDFVRDFGGKF